MIVRRCRRMSFRLQSYCDNGKRKKRFEVRILLPSCLRQEPVGLRIDLAIHSGKGKKLLRHGCLASDVYRNNMIIPVLFFFFKFLCKARCERGRKSTGWISGNNRRFRSLNYLFYPCASLCSIAPQNRLYLRDIQHFNSGVRDLHSS